MSVQIGYTKQVIFGIMFLLIILIVVEGFAKVWWYQLESCAFEDSDVYEGVSPEIKRQMCVESYQLQISEDGADPNQDFETININSYGFRGKEISIQKPENTFRIFGVGGSTMMGSGSLSDVTTITGFLQNEFDKLNLQYNVEVINAGVSGAWSHTEVNLIKTKLLRFNPDLFIIYDGWNDSSLGGWTENNDNAEEVVSKWISRWTEICNLGKENNFKTVIFIQPILGTSDRTLSEKEFSKYLEVKDGQDLKRLVFFAEALDELKTVCDGTADLRHAFDGIDAPIYWDSGHMANTGNKIISKKMFQVIYPLVDDGKDNEFRVFDQQYTAEEISSVVYDGREITVNVELLPQNGTDDKELKIIAHDTTKSKIVQDATYFLSISKDGENLLRNYFFAEDGILNIHIQSSSETTINVIGEKQYDHDAYVMPGSKYGHEMSGKNLTSKTPIQITGPIFDTPGVYTFDIELRTIDSHDNWVFNLSGFNSQITIREDGALENTIVKTEPSFEEDSFSNEEFDITDSEIADQATKDFGVTLKRVILQNYKTPFLVQQLFIGTQEQLVTQQPVKGENVKIISDIDFSNLSDVDLSKGYFPNVDLSEKNLSKSNFSGAYLKNSNFNNSELFETKFAFANMIGATLSFAQLEYADFQSADMLGAVLSNSNLRHANFDNADLLSVNFRDSDLSHVDLSYANLAVVDFQGANMEFVNLEGQDLRRMFLMNANLSNANLHGTYIETAYLKNAILTGANFSGATFTANNFSGWNLTNVNFSSIPLYDADFSNSNLTGVDFSDSDLSNVNFENSNLEDALGGPFIGCKNHRLCE